jgi:hypothetical protein
MINICIFPLLYKNQFRYCLMLIKLFRVKNHDFTPKNHICPILGGVREIFGVFHVKNHDFTPKNHIFTNFRGARAGRAPPPSAPPGPNAPSTVCHEMWFFAF